MKQRFIFSIIILTLLSLPLLANDALSVNEKIMIEEQRNHTMDRDPSPSYQQTAIPTDEIFDLIDHFPVGIGGGEYSVTTDGDHIYTAAWNSTGFYRYETDGTYIGEFTIAGAGNFRDLTYDGEYFYGSPNSNTIYELDLDGESLIGSFTTTASSSVRGIAYDPDHDGFWVTNGWDPPLTLIDRSGTTISTINPTASSFSGLGWENVTPDGPHLWAYTQELGTNQNNLVQLDISNGSTVQTFDVFTLGILAGDAISGGMDITDELVAGKWTFIGTSQNDVIWIIELGDAADPEAPAMPTDFVVTPDAGGALEANLSWTNPDTQVNGDPLTELTAIHVYRGEDIVYTDNNPTIGGTDNYSDTVTESGMYAYQVVGENSFGEGIPAAENAWVGEDVPAAVEDLTAVQTTPDDMSVTLTWNNPTEGLNGGAFNEPILGYEITRSDGEVFDLTGIQTEFIDDDIPYAGGWHYTVIPYNSIGDGGSATSNTVMVTPEGTAMLGSGTVVHGTTAGSPINIFYRSLRGQTVYTADELNASGITGPAALYQIGFYVDSPPDLPLPNFIIRMKHTTAPNVAAHDNGPFELVYSTATYMPTPGDYDLLVLDEPFIWNGVDNILVDTAFDMVDSWSSTGIVRVYDPPVPDGYRFGRSDSQNMATQPTTTVSDNKPQAMMIFGDPPAGPWIGVDTEEFDLTLFHEQILTLPLTISNSGQSDLTFSITVDEDTRQIVVHTITEQMIEDGKLPKEMRARNVEPTVFTTEQNRQPGRPDWLTIDPMSGTVAAGDNMELDVTFDATGVEAGNYSADITIEHNAQGEDIIIPCTVNVLPEGVVIYGEGDNVNGTTTANPINTYYKSLRGQMVYHAADIIDAGIEPGSAMIEFAFYVESPPQDPLPNFLVRMKHTTADNVAAHDAGPFETVYSTASYMPTPGGWDMILLDTPFIWNGTDNILIDTAFSMLDNYNASGQQRIYDVPDGFRYVRSDMQDCTNEPTTNVASDKPQLMMIFGEPVEFGSIEGNVTLDDGPGDVTLVEVTAGNVTVNPDASGDYVIDISPGTYNVTASLDGYESETIEDVVVQEGQATTGIDFVLTYLTPPPPPAPENVEIDEYEGILTWDPPAGADLHQLSYHNNVPENAYFQQYDYGYGVVYDVSGYSDVTVEYTDYRHSSWGIFGEWDYKIHVVNWDTYELMHTTDVLQTEVNDGWELDIELGSLSASGFVGIFLEPMDNAPDDAYPCMDADAEATDSSYFGPLPDFSGMNLNSADVGNFLMDLWIMGNPTRGGERQLVKASVFENSIEHQMRRSINVNHLGEPSEQTSTTMRTDPDSYNVYLDGNGVANVTETSYQYEELVYGQTYVAGVSAVYDGEESEIVEVEFEYTGVSADDPVVTKTQLHNNYPNPFNPETTISFSINTPGRVEIDIYNIKGEKVRTLVREEYPAGNHNVVWNGTDNQNRSVASGVYMYRMSTENYSTTKKMILMK